MMPDGDILYITLYNSDPEFLIVPATIGAVTRIQLTGSRNWERKGKIYILPLYLELKFRGYEIRR